MARTHPHIDAPTTGQLKKLVVSRPAVIQDMYFEMHKMVIESIPEINYAVDEVDHVIGYGMKQFGYNGWGMLAVSPFSKWVSLTFMQGARLENVQQTLSGSATMRHFKAKNIHDIIAKRDVLRELIVKAKHLNSVSFIT